MYNIYVENNLRRHNTLTTMKFLILFVAAFVALCAADPLILLANSQPKCMSVDSPADVLLHIQYEAPDLLLPADVGKDGSPVDPRSFRRLGQLLLYHPARRG